MAIAPAANDTRLLVSVDEAAARLCLHRSRIWPLMAQGRIRSLKIGRSRRIPVAELERFIAQQLAEQQGGAAAHAC